MWLNQHGIPLGYPYLPPPPLPTAHLPPHPHHLHLPGLPMPPKPSQLPQLIPTGAATTPLTNGAGGAGVGAGAGVSSRGSSNGSTASGSGKGPRNTSPPPHSSSPTVGQHGGALHHPHPPPPSAMAAAGAPPTGAVSTSRQSSFAAALRKLAKQAGELPNDLSSAGGGSEMSPTHSTASTPRIPTPKHQPTPTGAAPPTGATPNSRVGLHVPYNPEGVGAPPVVTIAPTSHSPVTARHPHTTHHHSSTATDLNHHHHHHQHKNDYRSASRSNSSPGSKTEAEDDRSSTKSSPNHKSSIEFHSSSGTTPQRGFQPYRSTISTGSASSITESARSHSNVTTSTITSASDSTSITMDPTSAAAASYSAAAAAAAAAYLPPFLPGAGFTHPSFRLDDSMNIERYRVLQAPMLSYAAGLLGPTVLPGLLPPGTAPGTGAVRYPPDLLAQHAALLSPGAAVSAATGKPASASLPPHSDRSNSEEDSRRDNFERHQEKERQRERDRSTERHRSVEKKRDHYERSDWMKREGQSHHSHNSQQQQHSASHSSALTPSKSHIGSSSSSVPSTATSVTAALPANNSISRHYLPPAHPPPPLHSVSSVTGTTTSSSSHHPLIPPPHMALSGGAIPIPPPTSLALQYSATDLAKSLNSDYILNLSKQKQEPSATNNMLPGPHASVPSILPSATSSRVPPVGGVSATRSHTLASRAPSTTQPPPPLSSIVPTTSSLATNATGDRRYPSSQPLLDNSKRTHHNDDKLIGDEAERIMERQRLFERQQDRSRQDWTKNGEYGDRHLKRRRLDFKDASPNKPHTSLSSSSPAMSGYATRDINSSIALMNGSSLELETEMLNSSNDYPEKKNFLTKLGMQPVKKDKRLQNEVIRQACLSDRRKRQRKYKFIDSDTDRSIFSTLLPYTNEGSVPSTQSVPSNHVTHNLSPPLRPSNGPPSLLPISTNAQPSDIQRAINRDFAQDFHQSVLQQTNRQQLQQEHSRDYDDGLHTAQQKSTDMLNRSSSAFTWPGVEVVMESYQIYHKEQVKEKEILQEHNHKLHDQYSELKKQAQECNEQVQNRIGRNSSVEEERNSLQTTLEMYKTTLLACKK